jgi:hypothetical protein
MKAKAGALAYDVLGPCPLQVKSIPPTIREVDSISLLAPSAKN